MDRFDKELFKILKSHNPDADPSVFKEWGDSTSFWASENYRTAERWFDTTLHLLRKKLDDVDVEKFLINLHGIYVDLPEFVAKQTGTWKVLGFRSISEYIENYVKTLRNWGMKVHLFTLIELQNAFSDFIGKLSNEEIFAITYYRNTHCHPTLKAYKVKLSRKKGGPVEFDSSRYIKFRTLQPYDELDLVKNMHERLQGEIETLQKIQELFRRLKS